MSRESGWLPKRPLLWNTDSPYTVRLITDTLCGVSPLPDSAPRCYNVFTTEGMMDHNRFDDLAEPWLRRLDEMRYSDGIGTHWCELYAR
jgi:hypothetical protein